MGSLRKVYNGNSLSRMKILLRETLVNEINKAVAGFKNPFIRNRTIKLSEVYILSILERKLKRMKLSPSAQI